MEGNQCSSNQFNLGWHFVVFNWNHIKWSWFHLFLRIVLFAFRFANVAMKDNQNKWTHLANKGIITNWLYIKLCQILEHKFKFMRRLIEFGYDDCLWLKLYRVTPWWKHCTQHTNGFSQSGRVLPYSGQGVGLNWYNLIVLLFIIILFNMFYTTN